MLRDEDPDFRGCGVEDCDQEIEGDAVEIIWLFHMASDQLRGYGEMGGGVALDLVAVKFLFDLYDVAVEKRQLYAEWIKVLVNELVVTPMMSRGKDGG